MTNFGELPVWARPPAEPASRSKKRKDRKAAKESEKTARAAEKAAKSAGTAEASTPVEGNGHGEAAPGGSQGRRSSGTATTELPSLPAWAGGSPSADEPSSKRGRGRRAEPAVEPEVEPEPVVRLELDPGAPVDAEYGRRITVQQFSTKRIEVFEHAAVRITGPLAPNPSFETLMSISFTQPEEKNRGRFGKLIEKTTAKSYQLLDEQQPMPEACVTIVTDVRTHEIHEAPPTPAGITAGLLLMQAGDLATAPPADQARRFRELLGGPASADDAVGVDAEADADLPDSTGDYSRSDVVEMARGWAPPPLTPTEPAPWPAVASPSPATPSSPPMPPASASPVADATQGIGMVDPLVAEITRAVEEAASSLSAPLQPIAVPPPGMSLPRTAERSPADRLRDLAQLHRDGLLSDAEFERKREAILGEL